METVAEGSRPALQLLEDPDFAWGRIWPLVSGGENKPSGTTLDLTVHRRRSDGRAVAEYGFGAGIRVFAKLYPDAVAGRTVYRIHEELCRHGLGAGSPYVAPEPIAYLEDQGVLLLRPAAGERLSEVETRDAEAFQEGVTRAARWLAELHGCPVAVGPRDTGDHGLARLERRTAKAVASCPELADVFRVAFAQLQARSGTVGRRGAHVQTHGRYHAVHVFVTPQCVTAVDLDRAAVADPAKDVGEFLYVLQVIANERRRTGRTVDDLCSRFLEEYLERSDALPELVFYWSYSILWAMLRLALKDRPKRRRWAQRVEYLKAEFEDVPRRAAALRAS